MPPVTPPTITALPTPPTRSDPASFAERGDTFLGALPAFGTQANALAANAYANAVDAAGSAAGADTARGLAQDAQGAAQLAVQQAAAATAAPLWAPGTWAQGAVAWSPSTRWVYRRRGATGVSTLDPAADPVHWTLAAPADLPVLTVGGTTATMSPGARYSLVNPAATTATLPASPQPGDVVAVVATNLRRDNTVARNGQLIEGLAENLVLNRLGAAIGLAFVGGARGWAIVRFDTLDRSFPLPVDAQGRLLANVAHRTGTLASLLSLAGSAGEISADPAAGALVLHTGTAGQARQVGGGRAGRLLVRARIAGAGTTPPNSWTTVAGWTSELFDPDSIFNPTTGVLSVPAATFRRITVYASMTWNDSSNFTGTRRLRVLGTQTEENVIFLIDTKTAGVAMFTVSGGEAVLDVATVHAEGYISELRLQAWQTESGSLNFAHGILEFWGEPL